MTIKTNFTPGPWEVDFENCHAGQVATCHGDGEGYYEVWSRSWLEQGIDQKANALLIAAAPRMYAALDAMANGDGLPPGETIERILADARGES